IAPPPPASVPLVSRELVRQLSRAAALADRVCLPAPETPTERMHAQRMAELRSEAKAELRELRDRLAGMALD
ncbi:MAG: hypothetical protein ABSB33_06725, partial [Tepidisphaeraceae bacterium]